MRPARIVTHTSALSDNPGKLQHVVELTSKRDSCIGPLCAVAQVDLLESLEQFNELGIRFFRFLL